MVDMTISDRRDWISGTYEDLASEYYDEDRHPTCANFREGSSRLLCDWLRTHRVEQAWLGEVGPGKSVVAELLAADDVPLGRLVLIDSSPSMLAYSKGRVSRGVRLLIGDATALPLVSESVDLLVSSLGDSYNVGALWREVYRVLRPGGMSLFTTPSYDWARSFRRTENPDNMMLAEFELSDGRHVAVPSWIYPVRSQVNLIESSGLLVKDLADVAISDLKSGRLSPKLVIERGMDASVVTGYVVSKAVTARQ